MIEKRKFLPIAAIAAVALTVAACGGGGGTDMAAGMDTNGDMEMESSALETASDLAGRLEGVKVDDLLANAIKYAGMLTADSVDGDSAMAAANAGMVLAAEKAINDAVTDADTAIMEANAAKTAAEDIENAAEKDAVMRLLDDAIETAEAVKKAAQAIIDDVTVSGNDPVLDTLSEAVAMVTGGEAADPPMTAADAGEAVAATVKTAIGAVALGAIGTAPMDSPQMNDSMAIGAMTWAMIVGEDNVMDVRRFDNSLISAVKAMSVMGSMSDDLAATDATVPDDGSDSVDGADFDAIYKGIDGTVFCGSTDCKTDADGNLTGSWYFTPEDGDELYVSDEDGSYMVAMMYARYGYWLTYSDGDASAVHTYAAVGHDDTNKDNLNLAGEGDPVADVTAEYNGSAVGISETDGRSGEFTATVNLTAKFGESPMLGGSISGFEGDAVGNWNVMLADTELSTAAAATGVTYGGTGAGAWTAQGYGPAQEVVDNENVDSRPTGFFGRFNANFSDGSAAGAYATRAAE